MMKKFDTIDEFIKKSRCSIVIYFFFILFSYGIKLFHVIVSIDTESIISVPEALYKAWFGMGRFGAVLLKKILGTYWFNPYVASFMMVVMLLVGGLIWMYLFSNLNDSLSKIGWIFPTVFFTSPIMAEQSSFLLQAYEGAFCIALVGVSLIFFFKAIYYSKGYYYILSTICIFFSFSTYQSTVILFITGAISSFLLFYDDIDRIQVKEDKTFKQVKHAEDSRTVICWRTIGELILEFVLAYFIYSVVNKIVLSVLNIQTHPYITDQVRWGKDSLNECLRNIVKQAKNILFGKSVYYNFALVVLIVVFLIYISLQFVQKKKAYYIYFLASLALCICPFIMILLLGGTASVRTEWTIPFVTAFLSMYLAGHIICFDRDIIPLSLKRAALLGFFALSMQQASVTARIYYTEYAKFQQDMVLAIKISDRIDQLNLGDPPENPVVFIGARPTHITPSMYTEKEIELSGRSLFSMSFYTQHGTYVMRNFMKSIGYEYAFPSEEQIQKAEEISKTMNSWPDTNSVKNEEGIIVVRLS